MSKLYSGWLGKSVVLRVASGGLNVALRCVLFGESADKLHIPIGEIWEVHICKDMVQIAEAGRRFSPC